MIERHETVISEYTDEYLREYRQQGDGQRAYADALLVAPPEYRQGVEIAVFAMTTTVKSRPSSHNKDMLESYREPTGVLPADARRAALAQLAAQGVKLLVAPALN
jgi:hypothetical protein